MSNHTRTVTYKDTENNCDREVEVQFLFREGSAATRDCPADAHEISIVYAVDVDTGEDLYKFNEELLCSLYEIDPYDLVQEQADAYAETLGDEMRENNC